MSSIKKYVKETNEWMKFSDTSYNIGDLSSARNVKVDYGNFGDDSVNSVLQTHEEEIQKLKRNVSWLALHGGGGSGSGSGGSSSTKKASCVVDVNGQTDHKIYIASNEDLIVNLTTVKPNNDYETPWSITVTIEDEIIYKSSKALLEGGTSISFNVSWDLFSKFFDGDGKTTSHSITVTAKYYNETTQIESPNIPYSGYIVIPSMACAVTVKSKIDSTDETSKGIVTSNSSVTGIIKITTIAKSTQYGEITYDYSEKPKTDENFSYEFDILDSFKINNEVKCGLYDLDVKVLFKRDGSENWVQLDGSLSNFRTFVYGIDSNVYAIFTGLSYDQTKPTEIKDHLKQLKFSFYASTKQSSEFTYSINAIDTTSGSSEQISIITSKNGIFDTDINVDKVVNELNTSHTYTLNLIITVNKISTTFNGYIKCIKSEYEWIKYSNDSTYGGRYHSIFSMNPLDQIFNESLKKNYSIITPCTNTDILDNNVSSIVNFTNITSRSGRYKDSNLIKSLRLYDTYFNLVNEFKYLNKNSVIVTKKLSDFNDFTFCISFKAQKYFNSDHIIFSILNNNDVTNGIMVKSTAIYVKNQPIFSFVSDKITTIHIVYHNSSTDVQKWSDTGSYYKIYVDGILSYMSNSCPFSISEGKIENSNIEITLNGRTYNNSRVETCNVDIYGIEVFNSALNEVDILGSTINNNIRTTYTEEGEPDFSIIKDILDVNGCEQLSGEIKSTIYNYDNNLYKYNFNCVLADDGRNVPYEYEGHDKEKWLREVSSLQLPITYIDITKVHSTSEPHADEYWSFNGFTDRDIKKYTPTVMFHYWDPSSKEMPISSDCVTVSIQGTSSTLYRIKNIQLNFAEKTMGTETVQDLFFVKKDLIPENSYVLKADIVDSSHANNASIGTFINEVLSDGNSYGYGFDDNNILKTNIENTTNLLTSDEYKWKIEPKLRHTVEGFQTLLFVKFYGDTKFRCLGIYSFNIGRNAARNLGFENITQILSGYIDGSAIKFKTLTEAKSPSILHNTKISVDVADNAKIYWLENSDSQNYYEISSWTSDLTRLSANETTNPPSQCRFWHPVIGSDNSDKKLDDLFEIKYKNVAKDVSPSHVDLTAFSQYITQVAKLPIEGNIENTPYEYKQHDIVGEYITYTFDGSTYSKYNENNKLIDDKIEDSNIATIDVDRTIKYYLIALLFGLVDNLDKNMSMRLIGTSRVLIDFYDMDTAFGLNNIANEVVSPTVGIKQVYNKTTIDNIDYPVETFDTTKVKDQYQSKYTQYLPEVYSNKLWLSLDTLLMRTHKNVDYSLYTSYWFKLREELDTIAVQNGYNNFIEFFTEEFFNKQIKFGSMIYNYDYIIKYINDFNQENILPDKTEISKIHGVRKDIVKSWLIEHIDFLDSYFYWRGKQTYNDGNSELKDTSNIKTKLSEKLELYINSKQLSFKLKTEYPFIINTDLGAEGKNGNAIGTELKDTNLRSVSGGTGKASIIKGSSLLKQIPLVELDASSYKAASGKLNSVEEINLNGLNIQSDGFKITDFYDTNTDSLLKKITFNGTKFTDSINLNLNKKQLLNINYIDIKNSTNINGLELYSETDSNITQHLEYLDVTSSDIESLTIYNQNMLKIPQVESCENLKTLNLKNWSLDGIDASLKSNYRGPINFIINDSINKIVLNNIEHITKFNATTCQNLKSIDLTNLSTITDLTITNCQSLTSLNITGCPNLANITINDCYGLSTLTILSNYNIKKLDLDYLSGLTALNITKEDVKNIEEINLRNTNISGISYYNPETDKFEILIDPRDVPVFDFAPFEHLKSNGITILKEPYPSTPDRTIDKQVNIQSIRFPNNRAVAYNSLLGNVYGNSNAHFTNLKTIYGHILIDENVCYNSRNYPIYGFFLNKQISGYNACPKIIEELKGEQTASTLMQLSTVFDLIENSDNSFASTLKDVDDLRNLSIYFSVGDFISSAVDNFDEFDSREWATNFSTSECITNSFSTNGISPTIFQYILYRYAIKMYIKQYNKEANELHSFGKQSITGGTYGIELPVNTFRYFGNTIKDIEYIFKDSYHITQQLMSKLSSATLYGGLGNYDYLDYNALYPLTQLTTLGSETATAGHVLTNCISVISDENNNLFSNMDHVTTIVNFSPVNFAIRDYINMPPSLVKINSSFINYKTHDLLDIKQTLSNCVNLQEIQNSFGGRDLIYKKDSFKFASNNLNTLKLNGNGKKYFTVDTITAKQFANSLVNENYILNTSYDDNDLPIGESLEFSQELFTEIINSIISSNINLSVAEYLYSNGALPYENSMALSLDMISSMFENNINIIDASHMFEDIKFKYKLVGKMFHTLTSLNDVSYIFNQTQQLSNVGIFSDIPYKLFYTDGGQLTTVQFIGTDRFDSADGLQQHSDFKSIFNKTFTPVNNYISSTSYSFDELSTELVKSGVLCSETYADIKSTYLNDSEKYIELSNLEELKTNYETACPIASVDNTKTIVYNPNATKLLDTLSTIYTNLTSHENWKTHLAGVLTSEPYSYTVYNRPITNLNYCFAGNAHIQPYAGTTVDEANALYNPFKCNYENGILVTNEFRNIYKIDNSYSHNGQVWKLVDDQYEFDNTNYVSSNFNIVDSSMSVITSYETLGQEVYTDHTGATAVELNGARTIAEKYTSYETTTGIKSRKWPDYIINQSQQEQFGYICAPDLFRYASNSITCLNSVFKNCDMFSTCDTYMQITDDEHKKENNVFVYNTGIAGRIPANLLWPLVKLSDISELFTGCYHITSYEKQIGEKIYSYIIPAEFFKYSNKIRNFTSTFSGLFINHDVDLATPFSALIYGTTTDYPLNINSIFKNSIWRRSGEIVDIFSGKYLSNINSAFYQILSKNSIGGDDSASVKKCGIILGENPYFEIFMQKRLIPTSISQTYYSKDISIIGNRDYAWETATTQNIVIPSIKS